MKNKLKSVLVIVSLRFGWGLEREDSPKYVTVFRLNSIVHHPELSYEKTVPNPRLDTSIKLESSDFIDCL